MGLLAYCGVREIVCFLCFQNVVANSPVAGVGKTILAYFNLRNND